MVEIALYEVRDSVAVERVTEDKVRVHVGIDHTGEHIAAALNAQGLNQLTGEAVSLFSDDDKPRSFDHQGEFVLISAAQG